MSWNEIEKLGPPGADTSAVSKDYVDTKIVKLGLSRSGFTMEGDINMEGHDITGLSNPASGGSAVPRDYVDNNFLKDSGILMEGIVNMNNFEITNLLNPGDGTLHDKSAISRSYGDTRYLQLSGGTMGGNIDVGGHAILSVHDTPDNDGCAVNSKYVNQSFAKKTEAATVSGY